MMRIERRGGEEWLVDAPSFTGCSTTSPSGYGCSHHLNGEHLATGFARGDEEPVYERWPIEPAQPTQSMPDSFALGVVDGLQRVESMLRDLEQRRGIGAERKLELLAECIAAEIADVNDAIANRLPVRGDP